MKNLSSILPAFAVLIIGIILSILLQTKRNEAQSNLKNREIELVIENKTISIQKQLESSFSSIEILQYLFEKNDRISRKEFQNYTVPIFHGNSSIKAISWVPAISYQDRAKFESKISKELGLTGFSITQLNSNNEKTPSEKLSCYFPVTYIEPFAENSKAIGYDIYSDKTRHATIDKALNKKEIQITPRIKLVQDTSGYSFLAIAPVLQSPNPLEKRAKKDFPKGLISAVYKIDKLINDALIHTKGNDVDLVIWDVTNNSREYIYGTKKQFDKRQNVQKRKLQVSGREWELNFGINPAFYRITDAQSYLLAGISISLLLFFLLLWPFIKEGRTRILAKKLKNEKTVRVKTEQTLSEKEEYNRALFTESQIGLVLTTMDGKLVDMNKAYSAIMGRTVDEAKVLTHWEITPEKYSEQENQLLESLKSTGQYGPYEKEYIHKDGHLVPVNLQGSLIERNGVKYILSSAEDITSRKNAEEKIVNAARIYAVISQINQAIIQIRDKDKLLEEACKIAVEFGKFRMAWIGLVDEETQQVKPVTVAGCEDGYLSIIKKISFSDTPEGHGPTGTAIREGNHFICDDFETDPRMAFWKDEALKRGYRSSIALPITFFGKIIGAFSLYAPVKHFFDQEEIDLLDEVSKDISFALETIETEKKKKIAEEEIKKLNTDLEKKVNERTAQLQSLNKELETFTYSVSHDLKAPLRGIDGYSKLLFDLYAGSLNDEAKYFLTTIRSSTKQMNQLIDELLEYSRMERTTMRNDKIQIKDLIVAITSLYKADLEAGKFTLKMDVPNVELVADSKGLNIALRNLFENAMKFSGDKPDPVITISLEETENTYLICVNDNGIGFDMKYHDRIFEIFQRLHRAEDFPGTGIGLAMVRKVMHRMHGDVWAESVLGTGSTFFLELPKFN